jgi:hypothetical protein
MDADKIVSVISSSIPVVLILRLQMVLDAGRLVSSLCLYTDKRV